MTKLFTNTSILQACILVAASMILPPRSAPVDR
jgi:hypothetical protein